MKFSDWASKKNKNPIVETLFKIFTTTGFLEEKINKKQVLEFWQGFPSDSEEGEIDDPFAGDEDAKPIDTEEKISNIEKRLNREKRMADEEISRKEAIKRKKNQKRKEILSNLQNRGIVSHDEIIKTAKDAMLLLRYKGMYERKKRIEELKKLPADQQNIKRIFNLLIELGYLKPAGVTGAPPGGDDLNTIKPERLDKAIENAKSEDGNDYPEFLNSMLSENSFKFFEDEARKALYRVFEYPVDIPYKDEETDHAIDKILRSMGKRKVTSHTPQKKYKEEILKPKKWGWSRLSDISDPQEIKNEISRRLGITKKTKKLDNLKRKEKTIGQAVGSGADFDPIKLVRSREKSPQMSSADMDRLEKLEAIRSSIQNAFLDLYKHNSNMFFVFATALGLEHDQLGKVSIPEDLSPLYKELSTARESNRFADNIILQKLKEKGRGEGLDENKIGKLRREANNFIKNKLMQDLAHLGLRTLRSESTFSEWLLFNY